MVLWLQVGFVRNRSINCRCHCCHSSVDSPDRQSFLVHPGLHACESISFSIDLTLMAFHSLPLTLGCGGMSRHNRSMTNSTPTILIWLNQYKKYQQLIEQGLSDEALDLKREIDEALPLIDLTWNDLEQAASDGFNP